MSTRLTVVGGTGSESPEATAETAAEAAVEGASALAAPLHDAGYLDDDLMEGPRTASRRRRSEILVAEAVSELIARLSARLLARLGGSEPDLRAGS